MPGSDAEAEREAASNPKTPLLLSLLSMVSRAEFRVESMREPPLELARETVKN